MSSKGQNLWKGISYQKKVNLFYLLNYFEFPYFIKITSEGNDFSDVTIFFKNYSINEQSFYNIEAKLPKIRGYKILELIKKEIKERGVSYFSKDKFLIVASEFSEKIKKEIKDIQKSSHFLYLDKIHFLKEMCSDFQILKNWSAEEICFLKHLRLVELNDKSLERGILNYFNKKHHYLYSEASLEDVINRLEKQIEEKSKTGDSLNKQEIQNLLDKFIKDDLEKSDHTLDKEIKDIQKIVDEFFKNNTIVKELKNETSLIKFSSRQKIVFELIQRLKEGNYNLNDLKFFIRKILLKQGYFYSCIGLLEKYIENDHDADSILEIIFEAFEDNKFSIYIISEFLLKMSKKNHTSSFKNKVIGFLDKNIPNWVDKVESNKINDFFIEEDDDNFAYQYIPKLIQNLLKDSTEALTNKIGIKLIFNKFNFLKDKRRSENIPNEAYSYIENFINSDFKKHFPIIIRKIIDQFQIMFKKYKWQYQGYELMGSTRDYNIIKRFTKCIIKFYDDSNDWDVLKKIIAENEQTFVRRSFIPFLLNQLERNENENKEDIQKTLFFIIKNTKGIPFCSEIVSYYLLNSYQNFSDSSLKELLCQLIHSREEILYFDESVIKLLVKLIPKDIYFRKMLKELIPQIKERRSFDYSELLDLLTKNFEKNGFKDFISELLKDDFIRLEDLVNEDSYGMQSFLYKVLTSDFMKYSYFIENRISSSSKESLDFVASFLDHVLYSVNMSERNDILKKMIQIIKPVINENHRCNLEKSEYFMVTLANFVKPIVNLDLEFAGKIIEFCINSKKQMCEDFLNTYQSLNEKVLKGQDESSICTMRGHLCISINDYLLTTFVDVNNPTKKGCLIREKVFNWIKRLIDLDNIFFENNEMFPKSNYYLRMLALLPLSNLSYPQIREQLNKFNLNLGDEVKSYLFKIIEVTKKDINENQITQGIENYNPRGFFRYIARLFDKARDLNEEEAEKLLSFFQEFQVDDTGHLFIYYALFREKIFPEIKFNSEKFKEILNEICKGEVNDIKRDIASILHEQFKKEDELEDSKFKLLHSYWINLFDTSDKNLAFRLSYTLRYILQRENYYKNNIQYLFKIADELLKNWNSNQSLGFLTMNMEKIIPIIIKNNKEDLAKFLLKFLEKGDSSQGRLPFSYEVKRFLIPEYDKIKNDLVDTESKQKIDKLLPNYV